MPETEEETRNAKQKALRPTARGSSPPATNRVRATMATAVLGEQDPSTAKHPRGRQSTTAGSSTTDPSNPNTRSVSPPPANPVRATMTTAVLGEQQDYSTAKHPRGRQNTTESSSTTGPSNPNARSVSPPPTNTVRATIATTAVLGGQQDPSTAKQPQGRQSTASSSTTGASNPTTVSSNPTTGTSNPKAPRSRPTQRPSELGAEPAPSDTNKNSPQSRPNDLNTYDHGSESISAGETSAVAPGAVRVVGINSPQSFGVVDPSTRTITSPSAYFEPSNNADEKPPSQRGMPTAKVSVSRDLDAEGLIQANLVEYDQADLVEGTVLSRKRLYLLGGAAVVCVGLALTLGIILSSSSDSDTVLTTAAPTVSMAPTPSPTESPTTSPGLPFTTTEELYEAVDDYLLDPSPTANSSTLYGYPIGRWNVSSITDMSELFSVDRNSKAATFNERLSNWDVSRVTTMRETFLGAATFNQPLASWNVSAVEDMYELFFGASSFNQPIGNWDVSRVTDMDFMFEACPMFNQPLGEWNVSLVQDMEAMFWKATSFNQPLGDWTVSSVKSFRNMFRQSAFNQPIGDWTVSSGQNFGNMFRESPFNHPIGDWIVSSGQNFGSMFRQSGFNQAIGDWDTSSATEMYRMFQNNVVFNQPIGNWSVSKNTEFEAMFAGASSFNQYIGDWDPSSGKLIFRMFSQAVEFNQDISQWNISSAEHAHGLLLGAKKFNQDLCSWASQLSASQPSVGAMFVGSNCTFQGAPDLSGNPAGPFCGSDCGYSPPSSTNNPEAAWEVVELGKCVVDGDCIASHAGLGEATYENHEACVFEVQRQGALKVDFFSIELDFDFVFVVDEEGNMERFSGPDPAGLAGRRLEPGTRIVWTSDDTEVEEGWRLCLEPTA